MKQYQYYIFDLDGTMYHGNEPIDGAKEIIDYLDDKEIPYQFLTNNSTKQPIDVAEKLQSFGIKAMEKHVMTSAMATKEYLIQHKMKRVFVIGEDGLKNTLRSANIQIVDDESESVDAVIVGLDREVTYEKFAKATLLIRNGAKFISTNPDKNIPTERGMMPGNGALTTLVQSSTGIEPISIGKPNELMILEILRLNGWDQTDVLMVGDNYDTDILTGIHASVDTLHVNTGVSSTNQVQDKEIQPTYTVDTLYDWIQRMEDYNE